MHATSVVAVAPLPPPVNGGIANWVRILRKVLADRNDVRLRFVDSAVRWRAPTDMRVSVRLTGGAFQAIRDVWRLRREILREKTDVVHVCTSASLAAARDFLMLATSRKRGVPAVVHYRMGRIPDIRNVNGLEWKLIRSAIGIANCVVVLDRESENTVISSVPGAWVERLPNVVSIEEIDGVRCSRVPFRRFRRDVFG